MNIHEIAQALEVEVRTAADHLDVEVTGGYASDLLSAVMANAKDGDIWVTWHVHPNVVAVAVVAKLAAIIMVSGREPDEETARKAEEEALPILVSPLPAFEIIGRLYKMGISGLRQ